MNHSNNIKTCWKQKVGKTLERVDLMCGVKFLKMIKDEIFTSLVSFCDQVHLHSPEKMVNIKQQREHRQSQTLLIHI